LLNLDRAAVRAAWVSQEDSMIAVPDLEFTVRIGALDSGRAEAVRRVTLEAGRRHDLGHEDLLQVARALQWLAVGHHPDASAEHMVAALFLTPAPPETCALIAAVVDEVYAATEAERRIARPPDSPGLTESWMLGWRLTVALELVQGEELDIAAQRERESAS
jgi:hypothetical protein